MTPDDTIRTKANSVLRIEVRLEVGRHPPILAIEINVMILCL